MGLQLEVDGIGYDLVERAVERVQDLAGMFLEIGTRRGGSLQIIADKTLSIGVSRIIVSVDPYGNILYNDGRQITRYDYTNDMRNRALSDLYGYAIGKQIHLIAFTLTDQDFFNLFASGVPVYENERRVLNQYAFAFLDGPHDAESILKEIEFLTPRMPRGANIVIDNIDYLDLDYLLFKLENIYVEIEQNIQKIALCKL